MTRAEQKQSLRRELREKRNAMTSTDTRLASNGVCERLEQYLSFQTAKYLHVYAAKADWHEIDITPYIEWLRASDSSIKIVVADHNPLQVIPSEQYDLVLVPMLAFDGGLRRLGMGMGWYDKFLARQQHAIKIGIAYDWAEVASILTEAHDINMDIIVTPTRILGTN